MTEPILPDGPEPTVNDGFSREAVWRFEVARRIVQGYELQEGLVAVAVAGSVGAGVADCWSDLELDCYWTDPPSESQRRAPIAAIKGSGAVIWDYDPGDREWSEDYAVGELPVNVSNFTTDTVEESLDQVIGHADTDPVKHMRLAAIQHSTPLRGASVLAAWQVRAREYPGTLIDAMVTKALSESVLGGWAARDALAERGDEIALHGLLAAIEHAVLATVSALNGIYQAHRLPKWQKTSSRRLKSRPRTSHGDSPNFGGHRSGMPLPTPRRC